MSSDLIGGYLTLD
jgi:hypothetical protein